jgi:predicted dehydrogenase
MEPPLLRPDIQASSPLPAVPRPILVIGAGGIVRDAHLPAYRKAGFPVVGLYDLDIARSRSLASPFDISTVFATLEEAIQAAPGNTIFDVAVPAGSLPAVLEQLPDGCAVLMQKPMGEDLEQARTIRDLCRRKHLRGAVNFQLRHAPNVSVARNLVESGSIGELHDLEIRVSVYTPWHLWTFLQGKPRVEILYHSIHYVDLIRSFLGDPLAVWARTLKHPKAPELAATRSNLVLDYGDGVRATISTNHGHEYGLRHQESYVKWECSRGAVRARLGLLLDYPKGLPDELEYCVLEPGNHPEWHSVALTGSWFPDAFIGSMGSFMRHLDGEGDSHLSVEDAYRTMAVVEAAYRSSESGGTVVAYD